MLYGTWNMDNELKHKDFDSSPKSGNNEQLDSEGHEAKSLKNFYKPWKESHSQRDNEIIFDYEQPQQHQQSSDSKQQQQFAYDV